MRLGWLLFILLRGNCLRAQEEREYPPARALTEWLRSEENMTDACDRSFDSGSRGQPLLFVTLPHTGSTAVTRIIERVSTEPGVGQKQSKHGEEEGEECCKAACPEPLLDVAIRTLPGRVQKTHTDYNHVLAHRAADGPADWVNAITTLRHPGECPAILRSASLPLYLSACCLAHYLRSRRPTRI